MTDKPSHAGSNSKQPVKCPECTSQKVWCDGIRHTNYGDVQRYLCRNCSLRFSHPTSTRNREPNLNSRAIIVSKRQVCDLLTEESKNLAEVETRLDTAQREGTALTNENFLGKIVDYSFWMLKQGYAKSTIKMRTKLMKRLAKLGANIYDPESIKEIIARQTWSEGRKEIAVETYSNYLKMTGGTWDSPRYKRIAKLPFIPTEQEIDSLIAGCGPKVSTFLQLLKETGMRAGEAWNLKWTDVDFTNLTVRITPEKRSSPRMLKISAKMAAMLLNMKKTGEEVFGAYEINGFARCFQRQRLRISRKLSNPRLKQITFHTLRHWKATMEYHKTKDILYVMRLLGHKNIKNTLIYTQLVTFENDDYICKAATNVKEAAELIEAGFEYVCDVTNVQLFRKRK